MLLQVLHIMYVRRTMTLFIMAHGLQLCIDWRAGWRSADRCVKPMPTAGGQLAADKLLAAGRSEACFFFAVQVTSQPG